MDKKLYRVSNSPIHGKGLFALVNIPAQTRIIEYTGEHISREEEMKREVENDKRHETYILRISDHESIDGKELRNDGRFANHSCSPNADFEIVGSRAWISSIQPIKKGEEITIDYAFPAEDQLEPCHCGSSTCRGYLNEK